MTKEEFKRRLGEVNMTKKEFASRVDMNSNSITNWNIIGIPPWVYSWLVNYKEKKELDKVKEILKK